MKRTMIIIITFCIGILTGIAGVFLYQLWGRPTLPKMNYDSFTDAFRKSYTAAIGEALKVLYPPGGIKPKVERCDLTYRHIDFDELMPEYELLDVIREENE